MARRTVFTGRRGLAPVLLTVVIVWALAAVLMLTGTLLAARSIDKDVAVISPEVSDISRDTKNVEIALKVKAVSADIAKSVEPLDQELQDTLAAANRINPIARSILRTAGSINDVAGSINATVKQIGTSVNSISGSARGINSNVQEINRSARSINASVLGIGRDATGINQSVRSIFARGGGILEDARSIEDGVAAINRRAETVIGIARPLGVDLDTVLGLVGRIDSNANSIDCSNVIMGSACNNTRRAGNVDPRILAKALGVKPRRRATRVVPVESKVRAPVKQNREKQPRPAGAAPRSPTDGVTDLAQGVALQVKKDLDKVLGLVPQLGSRANSLLCGTPLNRSACSRPR